MQGDSQDLLGHSGAVRADYVNGIMIDQEEERRRRRIVGSRVIALFFSSFPQGIRSVLFFHHK